MSKERSYWLVLIAYGGWEAHAQGSIPYGTSPTLYPTRDVAIEATNKILANTNVGEIITSSMEIEDMPNTNVTIITRTTVTSQHDELVTSCILMEVTLAPEDITSWNPF